MCGSAWQIVRAVPEIPAACKALIDAQYTEPFPLVRDIAIALTHTYNHHHLHLSRSHPHPHSHSLRPYPQQLPFHSPGGSLPDLMLYRVFGHNIDKHPNVAGQYLNALTFYASLFGKASVAVSCACVCMCTRV